MRRTRIILPSPGQSWQLTPAGQTGLERAYPLYLASVRRHILDHLPDVQLAGFTSSMEGIADSLLRAGVR
jgi:hypothetical protein